MVRQFHGPDEVLAPYSEGRWEERQIDNESCTAQPLYLDGWFSDEYGVYSDLAEYLGVAPVGGDMVAAYPCPVSSEDFGNKSDLLTCPDILQTNYSQAGTGVTTTNAASVGKSKSGSEGYSETETKTKAKTKATTENYAKGKRKTPRRCGLDFGLERQCTVFPLPKTDKSIVSLESISQTAHRIHVCQYPLSIGAGGRTCQLSFARPEHLRRHVQTVHGNNKQFLCKVANCKTAFTRRDNLRGHYWTHVERDGRSGTNEKMSLEKLGAILGRKEKRLMRRLKKRLQRWQTRTESSSPAKRDQL